MVKLSEVPAWIDAHGVTALVSLVAALVPLLAMWRALPSATRDTIERRFPRAVGGVRLLVSLLPDLVGAYQATRHQVVGGRAKADVVLAEYVAEVQRGVPPLSGSRAPAPDPINPTRTRPGFARPRALRAAVLLAVACLVVVPALGALLAGCPLPPPSGCTPRDTRCAPDGVPEVCSSTQRWTRGSPAEPCPALAQCCRTMSPWGRALHACTPASACIPESPVASDGGVHE